MQGCQFFPKKIGSSDALTRYLALWGQFFTISPIILHSHSLFCILRHDFIFSSNFAIFYGISKVCQKFENLKNFLLQRLKLRVELFKSKNIAIFMFLKKFQVKSDLIYQLFYTFFNFIVKTPYDFQNREVLGQNSLFRE